MITGVILPRNEEHQIVECIQALQPHVQEVLLIDMESEDRTVEVARPHIQQCITHRKIANFDCARNAAIDVARFEWLWFVDADERVRPSTGDLVNQLVRERGNQFEAILVPIKSHFCGQWIQHSGWWPGNTPRVLKKGYFRFGDKLHTGVNLTGRMFRIGADPEFAIEHYSYESIEHYLEKLNRYTTTEAINLAESQPRLDWKKAIHHMLRDMWQYYEANNGRLDGDRGWVLAWLSGQYRWLTHAKLLDTVPHEHDVNGKGNIPADLDEVIQEMENGLAKARSNRPRVPLGIVWCSPILGASGYAEESRTLVKALALGKRQLCVHDHDGEGRRTLVPAAEEALFRALMRAKRPHSSISVACAIPGTIDADPCAVINVIRTMFETDRIPPSWIPHLDSFDEVWTGSSVGRNAFVRSGVAPEKVRVVPPCVDTEQFRPDGDRLELPASLRDRFVFLSVFDWQLRKGWDVLAKAYVRAFRIDQNIGLLLKISRDHGHSTQAVISQLDAALAEVGSALEDRPDIVVWESSLDSRQMAKLYRSVDAFALATRGEGIGRPFLEAMATELPVVGTRGSGSMEFMNDSNAFLIDSTLSLVSEQAAREIPVFRGHHWFEPDEDSLVANLQSVFANSTLCTEKSEAALCDIRSKLSLVAGRRVIEQEIERTERRFGLVIDDVPDTRTGQIRLDIEGEFFAGHSFSNVNEQLASHWAKDDRVTLRLQRLRSLAEETSRRHDFHQILPHLQRKHTGGTQVTIRHAFPPRWQVPESGKWVHIQPWEFGHLPVDWVAPLRDAVDEIWVPSQYVKNVYERSGIPTEKVHVIPWGVDPTVFRADAIPTILPKKRQFAFLYVGGTIHRKGFDLVLDAYRKEFGPNEDVSLVIKGVGANTVYRDDPQQAQIDAAIRDASQPHIAYFPESMTDGQLAGMYTACDCLVAPYRGEGFGLPVLEAMACGVPAIVPRGGPTDDFVSPNTGYIIAAQRVPTEHPDNLCGPAEVLEVDLGDLRRTMRRAFQYQSEVNEKGRAAAAHVANHMSWQHTIDRMTERLLALVPSDDEASGATSIDIGVRRNRVTAMVYLTDREREIADALSRVAPYVDEIVAFDDRSPNRSVDVAQEYGARIVSFPREQTVDDAGKSCLMAINTECGFWIEAAERVDEDEIRLLRGRLREANPNVPPTRIREHDPRSVPLIWKEPPKRCEFFQVFEDRFRPNLLQRKETFTKLFSELVLAETETFHIVETACLRKTTDWGAGQSTVLFDLFVRSFGGRVTSIDITPEHFRLARSTTSDATTVIESDSVAYLQQYAAEHPRSIDLLYLDSRDIDWDRPESSAEHHLRDLLAAWPALKRGALIVVDDHFKDGQIGKSKLVVDYLATVPGATQIFESYQIGWRLSPQARLPR